jgi:hypothetical protein
MEKIMLYEEFRNIITKANDIDMSMEIMWKLVKLSRDMDEFRENFKIASDKDEDVDDEGEE